MDAIAGKELRYMWRDPRRKAGLGTLMFGAAIPILFLAMHGGGRAAAALGTSLLAVVAGLQGGNQFGLDGGAWWSNVASTRTEAEVRAELHGRHLAIALVTVPVMAAVNVVLGFATGSIAAIAGFGVSCALLGVAIAVADVVSVTVPAPVPERPTNAFSGGGAGQGCLTGLVMMLALFLVPVLSLPVLGVALAARSGLDMAWPALVVIGPLYGVAAAYGGAWIAANHLHPRMPEVLATVSRAV